ncbi:hypothetical protein ACFUC1_13775 [Pedococcus sp. NPDC057267]|uniref:hypothetical protein n=1 Tax=Pedococcus sp. NPDC057267 TaxID=3346077 RepID=UPI00364263E1
MALTQTPAPARSDVRSGHDDATTQPHSRPYLRHGTLLTVGAVAWASMIVAFGFDGDGPGYQYGHNAGAFLFQLGVLALLRVLWRTKAIGDGRLARFVLRAEAVALSVAVVSTLSDFFGITNLDNPVSLAIDMFWPLSMLGMFLIGIRIAVAGRWQGLSRFYPVVAESWAVVTVPTLGVFGPGVARWVGAAHLLVGYAVLGQVVARKTAQDEA